MGSAIERFRSVQVPAEVLMRRLGDEAVLLHLGTETYFGLDEVGARFWRTLIEKPSVEAAFEALRDLYDVDANDLQRDLTAFLDELMDHGLLQPAPR
jgi:hypothetical protein